MTTQSIMLSEAEMLAWAGLVNKAVANSISGLSGMIGQQMNATSLKAGRIKANVVVDILGGMDAITVGVYLGFQGSATGHMILAYHPKTAFEFIDLLMGQDQGTTNQLGDMEQSALQEMGNIMGGFFLNCIADANGLHLSPTPPVTMIDNAANIVDIAMAGALRDNEDVLVVDVTFGTHDRQIEGRFLVMPSDHLMTVLRQCWQS